MVKLAIDGMPGLVFRKESSRSLALRDRIRARSLSQLRSRSLISGTGTGDAIHLEKETVGWVPILGSSRRQFLGRSIVALGGMTVIGSPWVEAGRKQSSDHSLSDLSEPSYLALERDGVLEQREEKLWEFYRKCRCCPRKCEVNRLKGEKGVCSASSRLKLASAGPHHGEERPLVGDNGSGTVFFSHCNLLCVFCQNWEINHRGDGDFVSHHELASVMLRLQQRGCHNINLVTPTHVVANIVKALRLAIKRGLCIPLVYNTGGYDSLEVIRLLEGIVDIYLPDFKYQDGTLAGTYSFEAHDYPKVAAAVIKEMHRQVGDLVLDENGIAVKGLIIRHLVMPNEIAGTAAFANWVAKELSPHTRVNLMAQYRPEHRAFEFPKISRRLNNEEWKNARAAARSAGLDNLEH
jgi:putative pyruvate formate lyase activating enzyme